MKSRWDQSDSARLRSPKTPTAGGSLLGCAAGRTPASYHVHVVWGSREFKAARCTGRLFHTSEGSPMIGQRIFQLEQPIPPRKPDCIHYSQCLTAAARQDTKDLGCPGCGRYCPHRLSHDQMMADLPGVNKLLGVLFGRQCPESCGIDLHVQLYRRGASNPHMVG